MLAEATKNLNYKQIININKDEITRNKQLHTMRNPKRSTSSWYTY